MKFTVATPPIGATQDAFLDIDYLVREKGYEVHTLAGWRAISDEDLQSFCLCA